MKNKTTLLFLALVFLAPSILPDEPLTANDPLLQDIDVIDVYPMTPGEESTEIYAPEYEIDLYPVNEIQGVSDGTGPLVGTNKIELYIKKAPGAASNCDYIYMDFGPDISLRLWGYSTGKSFPKGGVLIWDLNDEEKRLFMENVDQESWDYLTLRTDSYDGILIEKIMITHSTEKILNWEVNDWLELPDYSHLGLAAMILINKLNRLKKPTQAAVHYGLRELGKTDGYKYGSGSLWCSEFASWCLRKDGWDTPTGSIGTSNMRYFFDNLGRLYAQSQILDGTYSPGMGDYLSLWDGQHSAIFVEWVDDPNKGITRDTRIKTIEGNCGKTVRIKIRQVGDIDHIGKAQ